MAALTAALAAATAANAIGGFVNQRRQASAAQQQGQYEQTLYNQDASVADAQAADALQRGRIQEQQIGTQTRVLGGAQRAAYAASGVDPNVGSASEVQAENQNLGLLDQLTARNNAAREAWGFGVRATQLRQQGQVAAIAGSNQAQSYRSQSIGTLLGGATQVSSMFGGSGRNLPYGPSSDAISTMQRYTRRGI